MENNDLKRKVTELEGRVEKIEDSPILNPMQAFQRFLMTLVEAIQDRFFKRKSKKVSKRS